MHTSWIIAAFYIFKGTFSAVVISPNPAYGKENESVTFNCTSTAPFRTALFRTQDNHFFLAINFTNNPCTADDTSSEKGRLNYNCSGNSTLFVEIIRLTRKDNNVQWQCFDTTQGSITDSTIYVNVSIENVTLSTGLKEYDNNGIGKVTENSSIEINCTSSPAFPNATVSLIGYDDSRKIFLEYPSSFLVREKDSNRYFATSAIFNISLNRTTKTQIFFCNATNEPLVEVKSRNLSVQVLYPPNAAPVILEASSEHLIIEGNIGHLTCVIGDSNPPTQLNWACSPTLQTNATSTVNNQANLTWTARRYTNTTCTCFSRYETASLGNVSLRIITLFPVSITELKLNGTQLNVDLQEVRMIEDSTAKIEWVTEGNPQPVVEWTELLQNGTSIETVGRSSNVYNVWKVHRSRNGILLKFEAKNNMKDSSGRNESKTVQKNLTLIVLYPPTVMHLSNNTVLEHDHFEKRCSITKSQTTNRSLWWEGFGAAEHYQDNIALPFADVARNVTGEYTCKVKYTMVPTFGSLQSGNDTKVFYLDVLYPPEQIVTQLTLDGNTTIIHLNTFSVVENVSLTMNCSAVGNPEPSHYNWTGIDIDNNSSSLQWKALRKRGEHLTCNAYNWIHLSNGTSLLGNKNSTYSISVLYSPIFEENNQLDVIEGQGISINCSKPGKTTYQNIRWLKSKPKTVLGEENTLTVSNVSRNDTGNITCELSYTMVPTYGNVIQEEDNKTFQLNILYPPENVRANVRSILSEDLTIPDSLIVPENDSRELLIICTSLANPSPRNVSWTGPRGSQTSHLYIKASRNFGGTYTCHAKNEMVPTKGYPRTGYRNRSNNIDFLYPPKLREYKEENVTIGTNFVRDCIEEPGHTNNVTVCWTGGNKELGECNHILTILNANANDSGLYNCSVKVLMRPTFGEDISLSISTSLFLKILAESNVEPVTDGPRSSVTGAAVGGTLAGVAVIIAVIGTLVFVKKRKLLSRKDKGAKSPTYENTGHFESVVRNPYEEGSNTYEGLTRSGIQTVKDHQYEKLRSFSNRQLGQRKLYENLQMNQLN